MEFKSRRGKHGPERETTAAPRALAPKKNFDGDKVPLVTTIHMLRCDPRCPPTSHF